MNTTSTTNRLSHTDSAKSLLSDSDPLILQLDPYLEPYTEKIIQRIARFRSLEEDLTREADGLDHFASGHEYFGLHYRDGKWVFREWLPNASAIYLVGDFSSWREQARFSLNKIDDHGVWQISLPAELLKHGDLYRLGVYWPGGKGQRIPAYARRVVQDDHTKIFNAQVWQPEPYRWQHLDFIRPNEPSLIYEVHIGMAHEEGKVGTYGEFTDFILPRIVDTGYNTLQLMALKEHPYYGSFGYHVSSFFAASSRFGTPEELKRLIDTAHRFGVAVIMDMVHSHAVRNQVEGLSHFDGTEYQYFHKGSRGYHEAWDSRCFDYGKKEVLHFLLSNCRYWLDEFRLDGFRFDGITSMLYHHHGLGKNFGSYEEYYNENVDEDALVYLSIANELIHKLRPDALTIAEDMSGMPGATLAPEDGGLGFDYRLGMGIPDNWIKLIKHVKDEDWDVKEIWYELNNRRQEEKTISYTESHDQALVGDQTLIFRLVGKEIYDHMLVGDNNLKVDRGIAMHKLIRLVTLAVAGDGYLNFMGNEFGHPEWIDFPREGNLWSHHYARRQWSLRDNPKLKYHSLAEFDRMMIRLTVSYNLLNSPRPALLYENSHDQVLSFSRANLIFIFNFNGMKSFSDYEIPTPPGDYILVLSSDHKLFGGHGRLKAGQHFYGMKRTVEARVETYIKTYLPTRTVLVLTK